MLNGGPLPGGYCKIHTFCFRETKLMFYTGENLGKVAENPIKVWPFSAKKKETNLKLGPIISF